MLWEEDMELSFRHAKLQMEVVCRSLEPKQDFQAVHADRGVHCKCLVTKVLVVL